MQNDYVQSNKERRLCSSLEMSITFPCGIKRGKCTDNLANDNKHIGLFLMKCHQLKAERKAPALTLSELNSVTSSGSKQTKRQI